MCCDSEFWRFRYSETQTAGKSCIPAVLECFLFGRALTTHKKLNRLALTLVRLGKHSYCSIA